MKKRSEGTTIAIIISGILLGAAPVLLKLGAASLISPFSFFALTTGIGGFYFMQKALYSGKIAVVIPAITAINMLVVFSFGLAFLGDTMDSGRWLGALSIIIGTAEILK